VQVDQGDDNDDQGKGPAILMSAVLLRGAMFIIDWLSGATTPALAGFEEKLNEACSLGVKT